MRTLSTEPSPRSAKMFVRGRTQCVSAAPSRRMSEVRSTLGGKRLFQGLLERLARLVAAHGEHDALEPAAAVQVPAHLLDLDPAASSTGKPPTPVPNATSASDRAPSSSALRSVARGRAADDLRGGRPAQLHRRRVDHPARTAFARRSSRPPRRARSAPRVALALAPPGRRRARSRRPRRRRAAARVFAALAIASTSSA